MEPSDMTVRPYLRSVFLTLCIVLAFLQPQGVSAQDIPDEAFVSGIVGHAQHYNLSCESRSAADWAAFMGAAVSEEEILQRLPASDNPEVGFVGDVNGVWGQVPPNAYGVHAEPIAAALRAYELPAEARHGMSWDEARAEIAAGRPMIVWIIGGMWQGTPQNYTAADGQNVLVARYEHSMILVGYSPNLVHVVDSYTGLQQSYALSAFLASWSTLGNQAVVATRSPERPQPAEQTGSATYTVQRGDTLSSVASRYDTTWQHLAALNAITYPYTIMAGQVLTVPGAELPAVEPTAAPETQVTPEPEETPVPQSGGETYIVQHGDALIPLAGKFQTTWDVLADLNDLSWPYWIYPGQTLKIPAGSPVSNEQQVAAPTASPAVGSSQTYVVQQGDYIMALARRFGVDWRVLAEQNNVVYPYTIHPGQTLTIQTP
ncbi:MAG TPA: LysM peptidoglycan-binding domain-containing protein, partial [Anaerolineaceae bacterium]|nr:LysM peptidoglycan-binding domain-containing protein [Anaerolineaceae bacterium]